MKPMTSLFKRQLFDFLKFDKQFLVYISFNAQFQTL